MLNPDDPLPLYAQLRDELTARIQSGAWGRGERIPTELELMAQYEVGRATVRQAILDLVSRGQLYRKQGKGTFVTPGSQHHDLEMGLSFTAEMIARGARPGAVVLSSSIAVADREVREKLGLKRGQKVLKLERLRTSNGSPIALELTHLNYQLCAGIEGEDLKQSLYQLVTRKYGIPLISARHTIHAELSDERLSNLLEINQGSPLLVFERVTYTRGDLAVDCVRFECRSDVYRVAVESRGTAEKVAEGMGSPTKKQI